MPYDFINLLYHFSSHTITLVLHYVQFTNEFLSQLRYKHKLELTLPPKHLRLMDVHYKILPLIILPRREMSKAYKRSWFLQSYNVCLFKLT